MGAQNNGDHTQDAWVWLNTLHFYLHVLCLESQRCVLTFSICSLTSDEITFQSEQNEMKK